MLSVVLYQLKCGLGQATLIYFMVKHPCNVTGTVHVYVCPIHMFTMCKHFQGSPTSRRSANIPQIYNKTNRLLTTLAQHDSNLALAQVGVCSKASG